MEDTDRYPSTPTLKRPYLGRGWGFPPSFDKASGEVQMVQEDEDIRESLRILLTTIPGERVMLPEYGSGIQEHVFDGTDETTLHRLKGKISDAILRFEPRILVQRIVVAVNPDVDGKLRIDIDYLVPSTNSRSNLVFDFYTREATNRALP